MATPLIDACGWVLLLIAAAWTVVASSDTESPARTPARWRIVVVLGVLFWRWPMLSLPYDLSPDESQTLSGALTLLHDPRFWISVDGATAGPLHFFASLPAALFPVGSMYLAERLIAFATILGTIFTCAAVVRSMSNPVVEQILVLSVAIAMATSRTPELQHFSTELAPIFLISLAVWLSLGLPDSRTRWRALSVGATLSLVPLAKLQPAPLAAAIGIALVIREFIAGRRSNCLALIVGALLPLLATATYLTLFNAWAAAAVPYVFTNVAYVKLGSMPMTAVVGDLLHFFALDGYTLAWACAGAAVIVFGALWGKANRVTTTLGVTSIVGLLIAVVCILLPRRPFLHYLYLALPAWLLLLGCGIAAVGHRVSDASSSTRRRVTAGVLLFLTIGPLALHALKYDGYGWERAYFERWHDENVDLAKAIRPYADEVDTLAIWGSRSDLYVQTRLPQAIPQAHTQLQISNGEWQRYYLRAYAEAFERNQPAIFVDAVGPGNFLFKSRDQAHEAFPFLARVVASRYTLLADRYGTRVYVRNDRHASRAAAGVKISPN